MSERRASESHSSTRPYGAQTITLTPTFADAQPNTATQQLSLRLWIWLVLTGTGAGLAAGLLMKLLRLVQHLSFHYTAGDFLDGAEQAPAMRRVSVLLLAGIIAALGIYLLGRFSKGGSDVNAAIWKRSGELPVASSLFRAIFSILLVGMGAALGREAALKQAGAAIASKLSGWGKLSPSQQQLLVACGAGAGMAAAYNVPLGGALFTLEVLLGSFALPSVLAALATSFLATLISWLMLPNQPTYTVPSLPVTGSLLAWAALAGPLLGLASAIYVKGIAWASQKPKGSWAVVLPVAAFLLLGLVAVQFPAVLGNGKNVVQLAFDNRMTASLLLWLLFLRPLMTMLCLRAGVPGGLFTPTMTCGALLGSALGQVWSHLAPGGDQRSYAILGAGAMLAAAAQAPVSSIVFMLELTHHVDAMMVPLLLATVGAMLAMRPFERHSIYSARM